MNLSQDNYQLILFYMGILIWLSVGIIATSHWQHILYLVIYAIVVLSTFLCSSKLFKKYSNQINTKIRSDCAGKCSTTQSQLTFRGFSAESLVPVDNARSVGSETGSGQPLITHSVDNEKRSTMFIYLGLLLSTGIMIAQFITLNQIPGLSATLSPSSININLIRQHIVTDTPGWLNYLTSLCIRSILPMLSIVTLIKKKRGLFFFTSIISILFCCSLIQKSYIALVFMPVIFFSLLKRKWSLALSQLSISTVGIVLLVLITNPPLRPPAWNNAILVDKRLSSIPSIENGASGIVSPLRGGLSNTLYPPLPLSKAIHGFQRLDKPPRSGETITKAENGNRSDHSSSPTFRGLSVESRVLTTSLDPADKPRDVGMGRAVTENVIHKPSIEGLIHEPAIKGIIHALYSRILIVPGQVVSEWFSLIPKQIPYGKGCGDRTLAKILGCPHINYSEKVYEIIYPKQLNMGIIGTVNAASFMEGYANFGMFGLVLYGIEIGIWLAFISFIFAPFGPMLMVVNALFILLLSSASFHTLLLSGGWGFTVLLAYILRGFFEGAVTIEQTPIFIK